MMSDDDDGVDPQFKVVNKYYFTIGGDRDKPVCFSVLPLEFNENDEATCLDSKEVVLQGLADNDLYTVHRKVVAWRVRLDCELPKISVLSCEGNWIELLKPWRCYEKTVRSVLITVQMLHFVRKWPGKHKKSLLDHLCEVFDKFDDKPAECDLRKHHPLIQMFAERDPTLMKSKILQRFVNDTSGKMKEPILKGLGNKDKFIVSDESPASSNDNDDYDDKDDKNDDDYSFNDDDSDDDDVGNGDTDTDGDIDTDTDSDDDDDGGGGTDPVCAMCDNGGKLLSCVGRCKRAFHPREKDGRASKCESLGYTSAQLKEISVYLCKNCEKKEHQCFKCGKLEPSDGPNAKVFQCCKASCGYFYHPMCVANLLEPKGACELAKGIAAGMQFACPVHWCSKSRCGQMEDKTQSELWLAFCRRCPTSFHRKCLPSNISFEKKAGTSVRAWCLDDRIIIYCTDHKIDDAIGTPVRDHIKWPYIPEINGTRDLAKNKANVTGKRKNNTDQGLAGSAKLSNRLSREEGDQTQTVAMNKSMEHIMLKPDCAVNHLDEDLQCEPSMFEAAAVVISNPEAVKGQEKQLEHLSSFVMDCELEKRVRSTEEKEPSLGTSRDIARKCGMPSTNAYSPRLSKIVGISDHSVQIADKLHWYVHPGDTIVEFCCGANDISTLIKEKLDEVGKRCNFKNYDLIQQKNDLCFEEMSWMTVWPKDLPHGINLIVVLNLPLGVQADLANQFVDKVLTFKPKLIMLVAPKETERLDQKEAYHLLWEYSRWKLGTVDVNGKRKDDWPAFPPSFSLWSCSDRAEEHKRITEKHDHFIVEQTPLYANQHNIMLEDPFVDKDAEAERDETSRDGKDEDGSERGKTSEHYSAKERGIPKKDTIHANQQHNDELGDLFVDKHAEGGEKNFKSGKERDTNRGENAYGHDSISGQEKETSRRENRMRGKMYAHGSTSGKEKIPQYERNKFASSNRGVTPDHVDGLPAEKQVHIAYVGETTTTNRVDTPQERGCDGDQVVDESHACQGVPESPQCIDNLIATEIDTSGGNSGKRREPNEQATDDKRLDLERTMKNGRDARYEDERAAHPRAHNGPQLIDNYKEPDDLDCKFRNSDLSSPQLNADQRGAGTPEYKSRERRGSKRRVKSYRGNSPMGRRNAPKRSRDYFPEGQRMDYRNYQRTSRQQSAFSPDGRWNPPSYPGRSECVASGRHGRSYPGIPEHAGFRGYDHANFDYGRYSDGRHSFPENYNGAYGPQTDTGLGELYADYFKHRAVPVAVPEHRVPAAVSVTDKYAPHLDQTNHQANKGGLLYPSL